MNYSYELKNIFNDDDTFVLRSIFNNDEFICDYAFINGISSPAKIGEQIIKPLKFYNGGNIKNYLFDGKVDDIYDISEAITAILRGDVVIIKEDVMISIDTKSDLTRSISEPDNDKTFKGAKEGFVENILINYSLIRRHIKSTDLKIHFHNLKGDNNNYIAILYMQNLYDKNIYDELIKRIDRIKDNNFLTSSDIKEMIKDKKYSPFKTVGDLERPDIVSKKILEGKIAIIVDGSPIVLTIPYLFKDNFVSADDYSLNYYYASLNKLLRFLSFMISVAIPALYIALVTHHQELIPIRLAISIIRSRMDVPFPVLIELLIFLLIFEILRETETRLSGVLGGAISTVGALIIGQSVIDAKIVSPVTIIVVSFSAITGLTANKLQPVAIYGKIILLFLALIFEIHGVVMGIILLIIHLLNIKSFGHDYFYDILTFNPKRLIKTYIKMPNRSKKWKD